MVDVCLPGTGGMIPLEGRWLTCCWMEYQGKALLIDCGEGTQIALRAAGCKVSRLNTLLITHYHADHVAGLPGLLLTIGNSNKATPLTIIGPPGLHYVVSALTVIAPVLPYPIELLEWKGDASTEMETGDMHISSLPLLHSIPCLGYRIAFKRKPIFSPDKARALGIPQTLFHVLHEGQTATLADGRIIEPYMVLEGVRSPVLVCYCTDTKPMGELIDFARDADLLISEGMHGDEALHAKMEEKGHMLFTDSARLAKDAHAKRLWLTHYSPALLEPEAYLDNARNIFPDTVAARDGMSITLGQKSNA
jgi:ribonuclease Z